ncbi:cytidine deaminase [Gluconacetobacter entanii]|uniref:Cytidine deaminase n=1 Tax=Gluconacetobacter entanii TaxID=108528 RepID=A0A318PTK8_9PROT|nr:cytidine deaminase [Gluconacetobacter entanii]MBE7618859.1 cytidine deaminase [Komagataeibacter sp. FXV2]MCE2576929.1 cytidine deaminase [Komagataeibacter sp. FNDCR1]MBY4639354.1 cytidine deaminase [Gluconacetobacter entanii]MCW4580944.1 cytidine deaminase [Gluconacetobacter entanii]MCW4583369.1 cytidine deaminase [Gluconacetobacter entanii]
MQHHDPVAPHPGQRLTEAAVTVRGNAHAPYSGFAVGAAVEDGDGRIFAGCNVENAAYPEGTCAEAGAIAAMVAAGGRSLRRVVVCGGGPQPCFPCGGCRQKIREFAAASVEIDMVDPQGKILARRTLGELLPDGFGPENL